MTTINKFITNNKLIKQNDDKLLDIFDFIKQNNYTLSNNDLFLELWIPLKDKKEILITETILEFMGYSDVQNMGVQFPHVLNIRKYKMKDFIDFLKRNNILYEQIDYKNEKCKNFEYIQNYVLNKSDSRTLHLKKWLILTVKNFKEAIMMLNNAKAKEVRKYYLNLEEIFYTYLEYTRGYNIKQEQIKIIELQKQNEIKEKLHKEETK